MKTIIPPHTDYRRFFPPFPPSPLYVKQQFCIRRGIEVRKEEEDAALLFNTLSGELVLLDSAEDGMWRNAADGAIAPDNEFWSLLAAHDFIVPLGTDMMDVLGKGRKEAMDLLRTVSSMRSGFFRYTVFTTTDCNARCFYCYQKGTPKLTMSRETALKTARFFERNHAENQAPLKINWFGGEPLLNLEAIDIITSYLSDRRIPFSSEMTTNGYLFTADIQEKAKKDWNLKNVQITLDGTEETYNKCKAYIYPRSECVSPFKRVVDNIVSAAGNGINVAVRMNVDSHNADNLLELLEMFRPMAAELSGHVSFYSHSLFSESPHPDYDQRAEILYEYDSRIKAKISSLWPSRDGQEGTLSSGMKLSYCMVDNLHSLTILPDGKIGKCEHHTRDLFVGSLDEGVNPEAVAPLVQFNDYDDRCRKCPFPPQCFYIKMCVGDFRPECRFLSLKREDDTSIGMRSAYENRSASRTPGTILSVPKIPGHILESSPLKILCISNCKYAVRGRNGNCLSVHFVTSLDLGPHSIQSVIVKQIGGRSRFVHPDEFLIGSVAFLMRAYLNEHRSDILLFSNKLSKRGAAIQRFIGRCFNESEASDEAALLQYEGVGAGEKKNSLSMILLKDCPQFDEVCQALSEQLDDIALNNDEVMSGL